jgi:hypothetical protein
MKAMTKTNLLKKQRRSRFSKAFLEAQRSEDEKKKLLMMWA